MKTLNKSVIITDFCSLQITLKKHRTIYRLTSRKQVIWIISIVFFYYFDTIIIHKNIYYSGNIIPLTTVADEHIEAYVALLNEMEAAGNTLLIDGDIPKSYKDSAD